MTSYRYLDWGSEAVNPEKVLILNRQRRRECNHNWRLAASTGHRFMVCEKCGHLKERAGRHHEQGEI